MEEEEPLGRVAAGTQFTGFTGTKKYKTDAAARQNTRCRRYTVYLLYWYTSANTYAAAAGRVATGVGGDEAEGSPRGFAGAGGSLSISRCVLGVGTNLARCGSEYFCTSKASTFVRVKQDAAELKRDIAPLNSMKAKQNGGETAL